MGIDGSEGDCVGNIDGIRYSRTVGFIPSNVEKIVIPEGFEARLFLTVKEQEGFFTNSDYRIITGEYSDFAHDLFKYWLDIHPVESGTDPVYWQDVWNGVLMLSDVEANTGNGGSDDTTETVEKSVFLPDVHYAPVPSTYYQCKAVYNPGHSASATFDAVKLQFDNLSTSKDSGYITKLEMEIDYYVDVDGLMELRYFKMPYYRFRPMSASISQPVVEIPKIIIIAGQHGYEKANVFGLYYFLEELVGNINNEGLEYIRNNVELVVIPVVNQYGFDNNSYKNANGVNLNRNYDHSWVKVDDTTSEYYGGFAAFSENETRAVKAIIEQEINIGCVCLVIDSHAKGSGSVELNKDINWIPLCNERDEGYQRLKYVARDHLARLTRQFFKNNEYLFAENGEVVGYYEGLGDTPSTLSSLDNWITHEKGVIGVTLEGFNGFPQMTSYSEACLKANAEIIGNFILSFCREYGKE